MQINVYRSNITSAEKKILSEHIAYLRGTILREWSSECTHLVTNTIKLTSKVLCALVEGKHIVNIDFWKDYVNAVKNNLKLPSPGSYQPELNESLLSKNISLAYNPERKTLFKGKIFAFFTQKSMQGIQEVINLAGKLILLFLYFNVLCYNLLGVAEHLLNVRKSHLQSRL